MRTLEYYQLLDRELTPSVKDFERRVYMRGMERVIDRCQLRGMSGELGGVTIRTYVIAGRVMVTLERGNASVSVIAAEGEELPRMGIQSCEGEVATARDLLHAVIEAWPDEEAAQEAVLHGDEGVALL